MPQDSIAIIGDRDGTLRPDTANQPVKALGMGSENFRDRDVGSPVDGGWDYTIAYPDRLLSPAWGASPRR